jgi:ribosome biogenesis GTPase A
VQTLDQTIYGLTNIENKCAYLPKPKDNLIKKYINNLEAILPNVSICLEVLEVRNPEACIDHEFRAKCQTNNIRTIISKTDTLKGAEAKQSLHPTGGKVLKFTTDHKYKSTYVEDIIAALKEAGEGRVFVAGKSLTGKHTLITQIAKHLGKYQESPYELNLIKITPTLSLIDSPYRLSDSISYPLFAIPNPIL